MFHCGRWLDRREEDGEVVRELPAEGDGIAPLPGVLYTCLSVSVNCLLE